MTALIKGNVLRWMQCMVLKYVITGLLELYLWIISGLLHCDVWLHRAVQLCFVVCECVTASGFTLSCWHSCLTSVARIKVNLHFCRI